jgi:outer membrane protein OmpA-like peptidoglycan-associated protein
MLLIFAVYFFINQKPSDSPRWSMNEIAPQEYQGASDEGPDAVEGADVNVDERKELPAIDKVPAVIASQDNRISSSAEGDAAQADETKDALATKDGQQEASIDTEGLVSFPEQKILIYFKHNSNDLPDQAFETLDRIADFLLHNPAAKIIISGYTDSTGRYSYNVSVSQFRANTIKTYLVGRGIDHSRIKAIGKGPAFPIATNTTLEGRQKNRRIEIELDLDQPEE